MQSYLWIACLLQFWTESIEHKSDKGDMLMREAWTVSRLEKVENQLTIMMVMA